MNSVSKTRTKTSFSLSSLKFFFQDIKILHSIFALPFALCALLQAKNTSVSSKEILLIILSCICARSFAMGMNRYLDWSIDLLNPRTQNRMIPRGILKPRDSLFWTLVFGAFFVICSFALSILCGFLSFLVLFLLSLYPLMKRFTFLCHIYLGFCIALAPLGVEVALDQRISLGTFFLSLGVFFWIASFDVIYALMDFEFDRNNNMFSIPVFLGTKKTIFLSQLLGMNCIFSFMISGMFFGLKPIYYLGLFVCFLILVYEYYIIGSNKNTSFAKVNETNFTLNGLFSLVFLFSQVAEKYFF